MVDHHKPVVLNWGVGGHRGDIPMSICFKVMTERYYRFLVAKRTATVLNSLPMYRTAPRNKELSGLKTSIESRLRNPALKRREEEVGRSRAADCGQCFIIAPSSVTALTHSSVVGRLFLHSLICPVLQAPCFLLAQLWPYSQETLKIQREDGERSSGWGLSSLA